MSNENIFLLYALLMGIFITFIYDILRIFRRVIPHGNFWVSLEDIAFWIYCAAEVFLLMYHENNGTLRWFAVLGAMTGMLAYKKLVSPFLVKYVSLALRKLLQLLTGPFRIVGGKVNNVASKSAHKVKRGGRILKKKLTFFLKVLKMSL